MCSESFFGDFGLAYGLGPHIIRKNFLSQICSRTIFEMHTMFAVCYMLLEQNAFQMWSWSIFNLEYSSRLLMVQGLKVLMVVESKMSKKCSKHLIA